MKHVRRYRELFEIQTELTPEQIEWLDKCTKGSWTFNSQTGLVDVSGSFGCIDQGLADFKGVRFGNVSGVFDCYFNTFTSLEGAPQQVGGDFDCSDNSLMYLDGAPQQVGGGFNCSNNSLTSLEGAPLKVGGFLDCSYNKLTSLEGAPSTVELGLFLYCPGNPVSESVLKALYKRMKSGMSWPDAVAEEWDSIESEEDKILLAPSNSAFSPEDVKGYRALAKLRKRML
jgi:hypothetical protein